MQLNRRPSQCGFTLIECIFAMAIVALLMVALHALNARCLLTLNAGREASAAEQSVHDRLDQLRACTWAQITDAPYLRNSVLSNATLPSANLSAPTETITVNAYPTAINPQIKVVRSGGIASTLTSNATMANQELVRIDVSLSWTSGPGGRLRTQATTMVVAKFNP